jgi:hypothetical protein
MPPTCSPICIAGKHRLGVRVPAGLQPGMELFYSTPYGTRSRLEHHGYYRHHRSY